MSYLTFVWHWQTFKLNYYRCEGRWGEVKDLVGTTGSSQYVCKSWSFSFEKHLNLHRQTLSDMHLAVNHWKPGTMSRHKLNKAHTSSTGPGSSLSSQPHVQPYQGIWVHWLLQNCCPKPLVMPVLTERPVSSAQMTKSQITIRVVISVGDLCISSHANFYRHFMCLCLGIVLRAESKRIGIAKDVCTQHQARKLLCTADNEIFPHLACWGLENFLSPHLIFLH